MTENEGMDQFDRLLAAGFLPPNEPDPDKPGAVFYEWFSAFRNYDAQDVSEGINRLKSQKTDRFWPSIGELRGCIAGVQNGRERAKCPTCRDSRWVEAPPYRANGDHIYEGVVRCPSCGVPPPERSSATYQQPLSGSEYAQWLAAKPAVPNIPTREAFLEAVRPFTAYARTIPAVSALVSAPLDADLADDVEWF